MPIKTDIDIGNQLTIHMVIGNVSYEGVMTNLKRFWESRQTINVLWDFRKGGMAHVSTKEAEAIINYIKHYSEKRPEGKTAIVVSSALDYGMSSVGQTLIEIERISFQIEIFRSYKEAIYWLGEE
jgi:hypothetical protein